MKKKIIIYFCIAFFAFTQEYKTPPDIARIHERGKIVVAVLGVDQPPFFYKSKERVLKGFDIWLAQEIAKSLGVRLVFDRSAKAFNDLVTIIANRKADIVISKLSRTLARAQIVKFTNPYITLRQALLINRLRLAERTSESDIDRFIRDFRGRLGVVANSSYEAYAQRNFPNAEIVTYDNWNRVVKAVMKGDVLAAYRDELEIKKIIKSNPQISLRLKTVLLTDTEDNIAMAVNAQDVQLLYWLNLKLESLKIDYTADSLLNKYEDVFRK